MQRIPETAPSRDLDALGRFFAQVQTRAREHGYPLIASIGLRVHHIDPLAVLETIYDPAQTFAYWEHPQEDFAHAAAESLLSWTASGPDRFAQIKAQAQTAFDRMIFIGDRLAQPRLFCRFNFEDEDALGYPAAHAFLPRYQIARHAGDYTAVANALIDPHASFEPDLLRLWAAYQKFSAFSYSPKPQAARPSTQPTPWPPVPKHDYEAMVRQALSLIEQAKVEKIVLASTEAFELTQPLPPLSPLMRLREHFPSCCTFAWTCGSEAFLGATPERLLKREGGSLLTEALAGSTRRGTDPAQDAALACALLRSDKDLREHQIVRDAIVSALAAKGIVLQGPSTPRLRTLPNVQHLYTPLSATGLSDHHVLDLANALHPTPATCGSPCAEARRHIAQIEPIPRGPYAGCHGWIDSEGDGMLWVGLRCALVRAHELRLPAGAGIVSGSEPECEKREIQVKRSALEQLLRLSATCSPTP